MNEKLSALLGLYALQCLVSISLLIETYILICIYFPSMLWDPFDSIYFEE